MPSQTPQQARATLFENSYRKCRVLRDIVTYVDGESSTLEHYSNPHLVSQLIAAVKSGFFLKEAKEWREFIAPIWQQLVDDGDVVFAHENPNRRSVDKLVYIDATANMLIRLLERRFIAKILSSRSLLTHP